jgi:hypothetical protein
MITSNTNKLNLRLIRVDMYLSQFDLDIRHKADRDHVIFDALFRLSCFEDDSEEFDILKDVNVYARTLMKMSSAFKTQLIKIYKADKK